MKVLITDKIADPGIELLRQKVEVDVKQKLSAQELTDIIGAYDALIVRSQTKVTAGIISSAAKETIVPPLIA